MTILQKTERPGSVAALAEPLINDKSAEDKSMNIETNSMPAPENATQKLLCDLDRMHTELWGLKKVIYLLNANLEWDFDPRRSRRQMVGLRDFTFTDDGIEATLWLVGEALHKATQAHAALGKIVEAMPDEADVSA